MPWPNRISGLRTQRRIPCRRLPFPVKAPPLTISSIPVSVARAASWWWSYIDNGASQTMSMGAGIETAERVANAGVQVVLSGYVGPKAFDALKAAGIKVCQDVSGTVREAVERFQKGEFPFADAPNK